MNQQVEDGKSISMEDRHLAQINALISSSLDKIIPLDHWVRQPSQLLSLNSGIRKMGILDESFQSEHQPDNSFLFRSQKTGDNTRKSVIVLKNHMNQFGFRGLVDESKVTRSHIVMKVEANQQNEKCQPQKVEVEVPKTIVKMEQTQPNVKMEVEYEDEEETRETKESQTSIKKNLLRNMAMLVRDYINSQKARKILKKLVEIRPFESKSYQQTHTDFVKYVRDLTNDMAMNSFQGYRQKWLKEDAFGYYYRTLTMKFYTEEACCSIWRSYVTKKRKYQKAIITLDHLSKFIRGLQNPTRFHSWS